jgi:hypothetical protein
MQAPLLESTGTTLIPINTLAPEPFEVLKIFVVGVHPVEGGFQASWRDANIETTGDNEAEAIENLKSLIIDSFEILTSEPKKNLGPESRRQLAILTEFIAAKR